MINIFDDYLLIATVPVVLCSLKFFSAHDLNARNASLTINTAYAITTAKYSYICLVLFSAGCGIKL